MLSLTTRIRLGLEAGVFVGCAVVGLRLASVSWTRALFDRLYRRRQTSQAGVTPAHLAKAVRVVSRGIPGATCLAQSLALQAMLTRRGYPAQLHLGVATSPEFEAHAWIECNGVTLLGGPNLQRYAPLGDVPLR